MTLGFLKEPVLSGSPLPETTDVTRCWTEETSTMMGKALATVPIPEPRSLVIETPKDFSTPEFEAHHPPENQCEGMSFPDLEHKQPRRVWRELVSGTEVPSTPY